MDREWMPSNPAALELDNIASTGPTDTPHTETVQLGDDKSFDYLVQQQILYKAALIIQRYWLPIIVLPGFVGNILALAVLTRPKNRRISCYVYMGGVAVTDCIMISFAGYYWLLMEVFRDHRVEAECKFITWGFQGLSLTGTILILFMTFDRFLAVCYPLHASTWCTAFRAKVTVVASAVVCIAYSFPHYLSSKMVNSDLCASLTIKSTFYSVFSWLNTSLNSVVAFILLVIMNFSILVTVRKSMKEKLQLSPNISSASSASLPVETGKKALSSREQQLTILLPIISLTFLLLTLPLYIRFAYYVYNDPTTDVHSFAVYFLASHVTNKLFYTNNAVNCYVYILAGSKFRKDLLGLFRCGD